MSKKEKEPKRKPKYGFFSCLIFMLKFIWQRDKSIVLSSVLSIPVSLILSAIGLYLPSVVLDEVQYADSFTRIVAVIAAFIGGQLLFTLVDAYLNSKRNDSEIMLAWEMMYSLQELQMKLDYQSHLKPETIEIFDRAWSATHSNSGGAGVNFIRHFCRIVRNILNFMLFGTVIVNVHPILLLLLIAGCAVTWFLSRWLQKAHYRLRDEANRINRRQNYLSWNASNNLPFGKDIRLFHLAPVFEQRIREVTTDWYKFYRKIATPAFIQAFVNRLITFLRDGVTYAVLIAKTMSGEITPAEFLLCFHAVSGLSGFINGIISTVSNISSGAFSISDYREAFDLRSQWAEQTGIPLPQNRPLCIEFQDVSFRYPQGEKEVLKHVSFKIEAREKVALVGFNGAGKTTLTGLMCGLLVPDSGQVLIDGHSVFEYNRDELYRLFSLVPQNFYLLPISIAENIALPNLEEGEQIDREKLMECIRLAGLEEKLLSLPNGADTMLNKRLNKDAVELSGGETQKLLFARALYRQAPVLILDEPTAALDPIAENKMYQRYNEIKDTTSVFISHRLASTRFCNRIFFIDDATIAEYGSHEELMDLGGKYKKLFNTQAQYYKENKETEGENA